MQWPPLPPFDNTPLLVMQFVMQRLNRRYPTQNAEGVDPQMVLLYRQQIANSILTELELAFEQTLQLGMQYWSDQEWMDVTGRPKPEMNPMEIQRKTTITATTDMSLSDPAVIEMKLDNLTKLVPLKDMAGGALFNAAVSLAVDPDTADLLTQDQMSPAAAKREKDDEYSAWGQIGGGVVAQKPLGASNQFRLSVIQEILSQPQLQARLQEDEQFRKIAEDRIKFFQDQIQQYSSNPQIGRTLAVQPFTSSQPGNVTNDALG